MHVLYIFSLYYHKYHHKLQLNYYLSSALYINSIDIDIDDKGGPAHGISYFIKPGLFWTDNNCDNVAHIPKMVATKLTIHLPGEHFIKCLVSDFYRQLL